jgi:hypothetical protein
MVKGNMGKLKVEKSLFYSGGEILFESMCTFEAWKRCSNSWSNPNYKFSLARD